LNVLVGALVLLGVIHPTGGVDRTALRWHVGVWDLWFLIWGILLALAIVGYWRRTATRARRDGTANRAHSQRGPGRPPNLLTCQMRYAHLEHKPELHILRGVHGSSAGLRAARNQQLPKLWNICVTPRHQPGRGARCSAAAGSASTRPARSPGPAGWPSTR